MRASRFSAVTLAGALAVQALGVTGATADTIPSVQVQNREGSPSFQPSPFPGIKLDDLLRAPNTKAPKQKPNPGQSSPKAAAPAADRAEQLKKALAAQPAPEVRRKKTLDGLFEHLRKAAEPEQAQAIAASIEHIWLQSGSDTANLLMQRAMASMQTQQYEVALSLFDRLIALEPDWAEAWNQRATTKFLTGDPDGAMADIDRVMKLEPRHFGAMAGMGMILQAEGLEKRALEIFKKALSIYPLETDIQKLVEKLTLEVEGQDI